jgi:hypothetical protein
MAAPGHGGADRFTPFSSPPGYLAGNNQALPRLMPRAGQI